MKSSATEKLIAASGEEKGSLDDRTFAWCVTLTFTAAVTFTALSHVMWRDEWVPLTVARHTQSYAEFFSEIRYLGRNGFFSMVWLLNGLGGVGLFKAALVGISVAGVYIFSRYAPCSHAQKALFAAGYYPLYEYGTILRDYGAILTLSLACVALMSSRRSLPLLFGIVVAMLAQTNAFGVVLAAAYGIAFLADLWRRGQLRRQHLALKKFVAGGVIAIASIILAAIGFIQPPEVTRAVLGASLRTDSHWIRLAESLPFPLRAWFPMPMFGAWNSQLLDAWPILQACLAVALALWMMALLRRSFVASVLFAAGMLLVGATLCHLPWTALRYHGPYFILVLMAWWLFERDEQWGLLRPQSASRVGVFNRIVDSSGARRGFLTAMLAVHALVGITFVCQERLVPFSGSAAAARIIRTGEPPDVTVVVDPDYAAISLAGCLGREVLIASRNEPGAFTKVDSKRRGDRLSAEELSGVIQNTLRQERRDLVLVTNYEVSMPQEVGQLLGVTPSITDERYYVFRIRYRRTEP